MFFSCRPGATELTRDEERERGYTSSMIRVTTFKGKKVAVFGLARSGMAAARALMMGGANVACWDDMATGRQAAQEAGLPLVNLNDTDLSSFAALVLTPGVPLTHPAPHWVVKRSKAAGIAVIGDTELFFRERARVFHKAAVVAITGTNGKSTTTALVSHILRAAGCDVQMGGNIGVSVLSLEPFASDRFYVIEMSSFQIDLTPTLDPTAGVLLNISPDHLDRHGTMENYAAIKARVVANADAAFIGVDDAWSRSIALRGQYSTNPHWPLSSGAWSCGYHVKDAQICFLGRGAKKPEPIADLSGLTTLRGRHNWQNAAAAVAVANHFGLPVKAIQSGLASFPGLAHRMQEIGRIGRVLFINDSKATNADSTSKALASFDRDIFWIAGGQQKEGGIAGLAAYFPRIVKAYLIGAASQAFAATLEGVVEYKCCGTLEAAVAAAARDAANSSAVAPIVMLSPACASYDQFDDFEHRGDVFRQLVATLPGIQLQRGGVA
jgi:UDP-N-acetylmuramoylalanine--D-glutamate ligase